MEGSSLCYKWLISGNILMEHLKQITNPITFYQRAFSRFFAAKEALLADDDARVGD